jgi:hypothetical protein
MLFYNSYSNTPTNNNNMKFKNGAKINVTKYLEKVKLRK